MCKFCEIDDRTDEAKRYIRKNQRVVINIIRHMSLKDLYYLRVDTNSWKKDVIDINYCPMCRKEVGRMKHITLKEMLEEIAQCILEQKEIKDYYWKDGEGEFRRITEIDLLDRIRTSNDDFTEFEWELAESRLYKVE